MKYLPSPLTSHRSSQMGFTLVELAVTVAVVAVLATLAIPSFSEVLRQWRRDSATRALSGSLQLARAEAIKSTRRTVICPSMNGTSCANGTEWRNGWIVFVDDGATDLAYDAGERVLSVAGAQGGIASLVSSGGISSLQFLPNGLLMAPGAAGITTTFTITPTGATSQTKVDRIAVSRVGRATVTTELP